MIWNQTRRNQKYVETRRPTRAAAVAARKLIADIATTELDELDYRTKYSDSLKLSLKMHNAQILGIIYWFIVIVSIPNKFYKE